MQPDLENIKKKIVESKDFLDRIMSKLPGFAGYVEKAEMHDADRMVRNFIADKIQKFKNDLNSFSGQALKSGAQEALNAIDGISIVLERFLKKSRFADYGTSASQPRAKVSELDLNRLLEYDWRMIASLDELEEAAAKIFSAGAGELLNLLNDYKSKIIEIEKKFEERKSVLLEVI